MPYPVSFQADYTEHQSRATTFFRGLLIIPLLLWLYVYSIAYYVVLILAWFALLFTGRFPTGMYGFIAGYVRFAGRYVAYQHLLTDRYPSFMGAPDANYPVRIEFAEPLPKYSRLKVFFRGLLGFPLAVLVSYGVSLVIAVASVGAWFMIVFTGRLSRNLHDILLISTAYALRATAYFSLLTETYPPYASDLRLVGEGSLEA
jgi:Domain of unknown function (DUF4389)